MKSASLPARGVEASGHWALVLLLAWPWVQPFSGAPLPNVWPWLTSWACLAVALLLWRGISVLAIAQSWALAAVVSSAMGMVQFFGNAEHLSAVLHVPAYVGDAMGNLRQRNQLATLLSMGVLAVMVWRAQGLALHHTLWMQACLAMGLAATGSRTGLLQILFVVLWMLWHRQAPEGRQALRLSVFTLAIYSAASWVLPWLLQQASGQTVANAMARMAALGGCGSRQALWANVLHLVGQQPMTGWGWDMLRYAHYSSDYPGERFCEILGNAHNLPLHLAFVWGVPAAVLLTAGVLVWVVRAKPWVYVGAGQQLAWGVLGVIGLHSLLEFPLWYGPFQVALLLCLWLLNGRVTAVLNTPMLSRTLAVCLLLGVVGVGYDHERVRQVYLPAVQRWSLWREPALELAQRSFFFQGTALFAKVTITPVNPDNAPWMLAASLRALQTSPEPRVIEKLLDSAQLVGDHPTYAWHLQRYRLVYPEAYRQWVQKKQK